jgi:hypothetical protein
MDHDRPVPGGRASLTGAVLDAGDEPRVAGWHVPVIHADFRQQADSSDEA